jgi:hypothetical protein
MIRIIITTTISKMHKAESRRFAVAKMTKCLFV